MQGAAACVRLRPLGFRMQEKADVHGLPRLLRCYTIAHCQATKL